MEAQATSVNLVTQENFQAVRTAQVVNLAQPGGRVRLINLRVKDAQQESMLRTLVLATHVPEQNTAKFTQQVVNLAQTDRRIQMIILRVHVYPEAIRDLTAALIAKIVLLDIILDHFNQQVVKVVRVDSSVLEVQEHPALFVLGAGTKELPTVTEFQ